MQLNLPSSNIELYYSGPEKFTLENVIVNGEEFKHLAKVMRHKIGDVIYLTNGMGFIYETKIEAIGKDSAILRIQRNKKFNNPFGNIFFCIPKLKSAERFEFAIEKSVELGITNFVVFESQRTISKTRKLDRWNRILIAAMKQSLRAFLPELKEYKSLNEILNVAEDLVVFEQDSQNLFTKKNIDQNKKTYFVFGPEGGLSNEELNLIPKDKIYNFGENRLRTETAVIKCASLL